MHEIEGVKTFEFTKIIGLQNISFGENIIIDDYVLIYAGDEHRIGSYVHIASFTSITGGGKFYLENFAGISSGCRIITGSDDFLGGGLTNPTIPPEFRSVSRGTVKVGKHAIIGANSVILPDVEIGEGCAVGAGSIITKNLEPWGLYVGNRRIKDRRKDLILEYEEKLLSFSGQEVA